MDQEVKSWFTLGREFFDKGEYDQAEKYFSAIIDRKVEYADVYNMLGLIYHEWGKFTKAQEFFEHAINLNPNYTEASLNLAVIYNDLGKYKEAKKMYQHAKKASQLQPGEVDPLIKGKLANLHSDLGDMYREVGLYDEAAQEYKKALILRPKFIDIKTKLADTYREGGNFDKAIKEYEDAKKISRTYTPIGIRLGIAYYTQGQLMKAKSEWEDILTYDPENKSAKMYLKLLESTMRQPEPTRHSEEPKATGLKGNSKHKKSRA